MTVLQVQADTRCLYIYHNSIYLPPTVPHHGHSCRTDVGNSMPSSHSDGRLLQSSPYYIANICIISPTPTSIPTPTPTITFIPTATPVLTSTHFSLTICPHGITKCGDNANPNGTGNTSVMHQTRTVTIDVSYGNNIHLTTKQGSMPFSSVTGNFVGTIDMGNIPTGNYIIKVTTPGFLTRLLSASVQVISGQTVTLPVIFLVAGDTNNDNKLDILDYNNVVNCFGIKQTSPICTTPPSQQSQGADINDSGKVDGVDYNLLLREFSVQPGG